MPGIDGILGTRRWMDIVDVVQRLRTGKHPSRSTTCPKPRCPLVRDWENGAQQSSPLQGRQRLSEDRRWLPPAVRLLRHPADQRHRLSAARWRRSWQKPVPAGCWACASSILIAQDTTDYGHDLGMKDGLAHLLESMVEAVTADRLDPHHVRLPGLCQRPPDRVMACHPQIAALPGHAAAACPPSYPAPHAPPGQHRLGVQHAGNCAGRCPTWPCASTFIVGYPGETEEEFQTLLDFVEEIRFDRVGAFQFSFEPGTQRAAGRPHPGRSQAGAL